MTWQMETLRSNTFKLHMHPLGLEPTTSLSA